MQTRSSRQLQLLVVQGTSILDDFSNHAMNRVEAKDALQKRYKNNEIEFFLIWKKKIKNYLRNGFSKFYNLSKIVSLVHRN